jgi:hypothetical protein
MTTFEWTRPPALAELAAALSTAEVDREAWADLAARAAAADTLVRVQRELAETPVSDGAEGWLTDFVGSWLQLGAENPESTQAAAGLVAQFGLLSEDQLQSLTDSVESTAEELHARELEAAGETPGPEAAMVQETAEGQFVRGVGSTLARRSGVGGVPGNLGIDLGVAGQAQALAGSLVPLGGLNQILPEAALISLAASAGMRLRKGESVAEVKAWLIGELSTIGVANAASVAVQVLSGLVVLRPLAVLGVKWGRARADSSAQATVSIRASRERLAPLLVSASAID